MRRLAAVSFLSIAFAAAASPPAPSVPTEIATLLETQARAWTRGDLDAFCAVYAEDATFVAPSGTIRGRQAVLDRYRAKYKDKAGMGALTLEVTETRSLGKNVVSTVAKWRLTWPDKPESSGMTLLVFLKTGAGWRIVQDASM